MAVETVATTDGGRVDYWVEQDPNSTFRGVIHAQKYDSAGQKLGSEFTTQVNTTEKYQVYALSNGGYVVGATNNTMDGLTLVGGVFGADGTQVRSLFGGSQWDLEVSPDGGFMVGSITTVHHGFTVPDARLQLFDNSGQVVRTGTISAQAGPEITVDAEGVFHASWTDRGGNPHTLAVDPQNPPSMTPPPAPTSLGFVDDVGSLQRFQTGGGTDDNTPTVRVAVSEVGWVAYEFAWTSGFLGNAPANPSRFVEVTAADVARGYVEIPVPGPLSDNNYVLAARFENADGFVGPQTRTPVRVDTHTETQATITKAVDNEGVQQGDLASGATTDDGTPTIHVSLAGTGAQPFDTVLLFDNGQQIGIESLSNSTAGGFSFTPTLASGSHSITAIIQDMAGSRSPVSAAFNLTVAGAAPDHQPQITETQAGTIARGFNEKHLAGGTEPNGLLVQASGGFGLVAQDGIDDLTIGGVAVITDGVFTATTLTTSFGSTLEIFSYDASTQRIGWRYRLNEAQDHSSQSGPDPRTVTESIAIRLTDRDGDVANAHFAITVADDKPATAFDTDTAQAGGPAATGNVLTDAAPGDAGDSDSGADRLGADGGRIYAADIYGAPGRSFDGNGQVVIEGQHGTLTMTNTGDYSYVARAGAPAGAVDSFRYVVQDDDGSRVNQFLDITITSSGGSSGQEMRSPGPGSTVTGGSGDDTLVASQGPDRLTGGAGSDVFKFEVLPWNAGRVTDFAVGADKLNLDGIFASAGYTGADPVADGRVTLQSDGAGGTRVYFDRDQPSSGEWPFLITTLDGVSPAGLTWAQLTGGSAPPPPPPEPQVGFTQTLVENPEGNSGSTPFHFTVTRTGDTSGTTSMTWSVLGTPAGASATNDDFAAGSPLSGSLTFGTGETTKTITVQVAGDTVVEQSETFRVVLQGITGGVYAGNASSATGRIVNDDSSQPPPSGGQVIISQRYGDTLVGGSGADTLMAGRGPDQMTGGGSGDVFIIRETPWNAGVITDFAVGVDKLDLSEVLADNGYTGSDPVADGWVRFEETSGGARVLVDTDGRASGNAIWFNMTTLQGVSASGLTWASLGSGTGQPPPPSPTQIGFSGQGQVQLEGGAGSTTIYQYTVTRTGDTSGTTTAQWNVEGIGANKADGADFVGGALPSGTVTFAAGETSKVIEVRVAGDTTLEPDEDFSVSLSNPSGASFGIAAMGGRIVNDDNPTGQVYTSDQYGDTLQGGDGHDTLIAGRGPDQLTGGAGRDHFVFNELPWNAGRVTDFTPGVDKLDLSGLFDAAPGGSVEFRSDGSGNTQVYFDRDDPNGGDWPFLVTTLTGVAPGQIAPGDWLA